MVIPFYGLNDLIPVQHIPGAAGKKMQDTKLSRGKRDGLTGHQDLMTRRADYKVVNLHEHRFIFCRPRFSAKEHLYPGEQYPWTERFGKVIICAEFQACHDVRILAASCYHDDGNLCCSCVGFELLTNFHQFPGE